MRNRRRGPWRRWIDTVPGPAPIARVADGQLRATFINHATVLLQVDGLNLLTDPMWSHRASPLSWLGPQRHRAPGIRFDDLPPIDCVLLSHNHYDHLDKPTLRRLVQRDRPEIFCPLGLAKPLRQLGFSQVYELDWGEEQSWRGIEVHCARAQHFAARGPFDRNRTLWCGWIVEAAAGTVYFAGDTGFGTHFESIAKQFPTIRLALLPIGAYKPEWFMGPIHMSPDEALQAHHIVNAKATMAIHFGTFSLADDGETEPPDRLRALLSQTPETRPFWIPREGEGFDVPK